MRTTLAKLDSSRLTVNESAWLRCQAAVELKDRGDYDRAREIMRPFWKKFGERPELEGLNPPMAAEVLLHVGQAERGSGHARVPAALISSTSACQAAANPPAA